MSDSELKKLADSLKKARSEQHLTQQEVADKAGIAKNYYSEIERAVKNPTYTHLQKIAKALGVKLNDIIPS